MTFTYLVLGAGPLGVAAAYDLAANGDAGAVVLADKEPSRAKEAVARLAKLLKGKKAKLKAAAVDPAKKAELAKALKAADGVLCALEPSLAPAVAAAAVQAKVHYTDPGCPLETARSILKLQAAAKKAGVSVVPDCGLAPGLSSCLAMAAMASLDFPRDVRVYAGALPQEPAGAPVEPTLSLYLEPAVALRRSRIETVEPLSDRETLEVSGVGTLEACITGGGSTCPFSFQNRLVTFEEKTLRRPGHFDKIDALRAMGFLSEKPVAIDGGKVAPRELFTALAEKAKDREAKDVVVLRVNARGKKHGRPAEASYELVDRFDPATGFSAAERATAFAAAAALSLQVKGKVKPGAEPPENALPYREFIGEIRRRGLRISEAQRALAAA